jgi:hypothetical protein
VEWIELVRDRGQWRAVLNTTVKLTVPYEPGIFLIGRVTIRNSAE